MKFTESMIRDYVQTALSPEEIGDRLTMTGFELEEIVEVEGEPMLDVNIMANRGDGASVMGMARELLAKDASSSPTELYKRAAERFPLADIDATDVEQYASVSIETDACTRYACRVFLDIENGPSPDWLQERLRRIGQRPISLLVDLTNYVMLETGQPLHAFDMDKLGGTVVVRQAREGETITTLDGTKHQLAPTDMMICDAERPVAVAGVMGGEDTEVSATTTRCLLESAHFVNTSVRATRKRLGLFTEASYRFERHVDPEGVAAALNRFTELYNQITGKSSVPGVVDVYPIKPERKTVNLRLNKAEAMLGMPVSQDEAVSYLTKLGFEIHTSLPGSLTVVPPTWRIDVVREEDLIEEIGRVHGYDKIPELLPVGSTPVGGSHGFERLQDLVRESLVRSGFDQAISHTMRPLHALDRSSDIDRRVVVRTPHSPEIAQLRDSLLPGLAEAVQRNGGDDVHMFETGRVFVPGDERVSVALLSTGRFEPDSWRETDTTRADFYSLKGSLEDLAASLGTELELFPTDDPRFHPTRQAGIKLGRTSCGVMGQIHPDAADDSGLPSHAVMAEIDLSAVKGLTRDDVRYRQVSRFPAIRRDVAVVIDKSVPFATIDEAVVQAGGELLERHWLFDVYEGKGMEPNEHSLALAMVFRKPDATFTDEEANQLRDAIVQALESVGARLR